MPPPIQQPNYVYMIPDKGFFVCVQAPSTWLCQKDGQKVGNITAPTLSVTPPQASSSDWDFEK